MEEQREAEDLDMKKKPKNEVAVFGFGVLLNGQKKISDQLEKLTNALFHLENKVEAMMDSGAQERYERIRRRF